jgi:uncharacterized cupredoxin-like copper-binding protein
MGSIDTSAFGEPGEMDMADRTIAVSMFDTFRFEPIELSVEAGETIAFEVRNEGELSHEFALGADAFQEQHEMEMGKWVKTRSRRMSHSPSAFRQGIRKLWCGRSPRRGRSPTPVTCQAITTTA